jgi:hypothetical protein
MAPQCERCGKQLNGKTGGVMQRLGLRNYEGYECMECGAILCGDCFRTRRRELAGSAHDTCPVCDGILQHR